MRKLALIQRKRRIIAVAGVTAIAFAVAAPQATAHVTKDVPHMIEHVLEALGVLQASTDAIKAKTDAIPLIVTDTFDESASGTGFLSVSRQVEGLEGKQFLANFTATCTFGTRDDDTDVNSAIISLRHATPTGSSPFFTDIRERSTDRIIQIVSGPVAAFDGPNDPTYRLVCVPGGDNAVGQALAQAWFEVRP